ncbi:MAG: flagellar hook protein FlgE [Nitrospina sp.]|nr:MAG: flagellar hook protein FlgE [Nitrospina sp.]
MSLIGALFSGVSGLSSNSQAMNIIGDNISNLNTVGFKGSKAVFGDLFTTILANGAVTSQLGRGTMLLGSLQSFSQGAFESTTNALDLGIDGSGFFIVNNGAGNFYTRAGQFRQNEDGLVESITGEILQGFEFTAGVLGTTLGDIDLAGVQSAPVPTTEFTLGANLDAAALSGITFNSPVSIFNSVGDEIVMNIQFTKVVPPTLASTTEWDYVASNPIGKGVVGAGGMGTLVFDTSGVLIGVNGGGVTDVTINIDYSAASPPAASQALIWDLADLTGVATNGRMTGFAAASNTNSVVQDGFGTGVLTGLAVNFEGIISGLFNNGQSEDLFQVALADFLSPTGLIRTGQNLFAESGSSGQPVIGLAQTGGFGSVLGSTLELSNVDLAQEFVTLIVTQQAFQASARIITTTDDMLTETVNLTR